MFFNYFNVNLENRKLLVIVGIGVLSLLYSTISMASGLSRADTYFQKSEEIHDRSSQGSADILSQKAYFLSKAIEIDPEHVEAWNNLGDTYENLGDYEHALRCYKKVTKIDPDFGLAFFGIGDVLLRLGRYDEAVENYEKGLTCRNDPKDVQITKQNLLSARVLANQSTNTDQIVPKETITAILRGPTSYDHSTASSVMPPSIHFGDHLIHFDYDKSLLHEKTKEQLNVLSDALLELTSSPNETKNTFEVAGHTDSRGNDDYNYSLGMNRALSVVNYLKEKSPDLAEHLSVKSYGETAPLVFAAATEDDHTRNRRVEIRMLGKGKAASTVEKIDENLQLNFKVWRIKGEDNTKSKQELLPDQSVLFSGDFYQFSVQPNKDCYVYIYQKNTEGEGLWLFPDSKLNPNNPLTGPQTSWIPESPEYFQLHGQDGEETIYVVASIVPAHDIEYLIQNPSETGDEEIVRIQVRGLGGIRNIQPDEKSMIMFNPISSITEITSQKGMLLIKFKYIHLEKS